MDDNRTVSPTANSCAQTIHKAFSAYRREFSAITLRAENHFTKLNWHGMRADATERLELYKKVVDRSEAQIRGLLAASIHDKPVWVGIKSAYSGYIRGRNDWELAETFFNSITRRIFATIGVDPKIEFVATDFATPPTPSESDVCCSYDGVESTEELINAILSGYPLADEFQNLAREAGRVAAEIENHLIQIGARGKIDQAHMVKQIFYRGMGAYIIGRFYVGPVLVPVAIALLNSKRGIIVDGILLDEDKISILFSFARSYFHVDAQRPYDLVHFLKSILPRKRIAELYISMGFNKHGKTELYRELLGHMTECTQDQFEISPGQRGMVMIVFNMPRDDLVFKLIRDYFAKPKKTTREEVMQKYDLVFKHDRAGRLIDAQTFEHLQFDACCFSDQLLNELQSGARKTVKIREEQIIVEHAYVERRVVPLNVFLEKADEDAARKVVIDFGRAIKDLAVSNIFPGDILLKNFGVTRHGRVVFYDYDELCPLTSCNFRKLPSAMSYDDEMSSEPWFYVDENDVFPEEFQNYLGLSEPLREVFMDHHADIFDVAFWRRAQQAIIAGELPHIFPYERSCRPESH
jgi:isocitrate dehydrogenase kinase/phosphatase